MRLSIKSLLSAVLLLMSANLLNAQPGDLGNWFIYFGHYRLSPKWGIWAEGQYRNYNFAGDLEQAFVRTALTRDLPGKGLQFALGYGHFYTGNYVGTTDQKEYFHENRFYQQFLDNQRYGRVYLNHRYRLEERFLPDQFKWRFRYSLSLNVCLNKSERVPGALYLSAYNEIFIQPAAPVFDRDRLYGAMGYVISPTLRAETGLMYQLFETRHRPQWQIVLFHNLDFSKHEG